MKLHRTDLAVPSLRTVVEFKFARTLTTAKSCVDEFYSDMKAYTQTHQWAHFYAVLYIRGNFMTQVNLDQAFKEKNADRNWTPILLTGPVKGTDAVPGARQPATFKARPRKTFSYTQEAPT